MSLVNFIKGRFKDLQNDAVAAKNVVQRNVAAPVARVVSNDVAAPIVRTVQAAPRVIMPVAHTVVNDASKTYDQVNPFDNGRTFQQRAPTNTRSVIGQVTHNGATNFAGDLVKPLVQFPLDAGTVAYNKVIAPHFNLPQQSIQHNPLLGSTARFVGATGTPKQTVGSGLQTALTLGTAGTVRGVEAGAADLLPEALPTVIKSVAPKVVSGSIVGGAYNAASGVSAGHTAKQILTHDIPTGAVVGGTLPLAGEVAGKGVSLARNATVKPVFAHSEPIKPGEEPLPKQTTPPRNVDGTVPLSADALKQSTPADAPTKISDALLAKQAKLQQVKEANGTPAPVATESSVPTAAPSLPKELSGAKPNYSYGQNRFNLSFPDDVTKSLYIVGGKGQSASHAAYMDFLRQALPGKSDGELTSMGGDIRNGIKAQAKNSSADTINVKSARTSGASGTASAPAGAVAGREANATLPGNQLPEQPTPGSVRAVPRTTQELPTTKAKSVKSLPNDTTNTPVVNSATAMPAGTKLSRFANVTVQNSEDVPENVKQLVNEKGVSYTPQSVEAGQSAAQAMLKKAGLRKATASVVSNLYTTGDGKITRQDVYNAQAVAAKLARTGKAEDAATSAEVYGRLSEHHTAAGQQIQAAAALAKISPEGLHQSAIKAIKNGGKNGTKQKISDDLANQIADKVAEIDKAPEGSVERNDHVQELQQIVNQNVHHSMNSKVFALWRTGLLTGPQTMTKVGVSHALMAAAEKVKDVPAVAIDKTISGGSRLLGKGPMRSTALTLRGEGKGFVEGTKAGVKLLRTGKDTEGTGGLSSTLVGQLAKPEVDFGTSKLGKAANFYVQKIGAIHAAIPKGFFTAAQANDLFKQAMAEGKNMGLKGDELQTHIDNYTEGASDFAKQEAQLSAQRASFQQDTAGNKLVQGLQHIPGARYLIPFGRIASTILSDAVDYSPAGILKAPWQAFKETKGAGGWTPLVQKHFVEELGRGITGTGAIIAGYQLYKHGVMTLGYPTSKPEQALWKAQGKTPNSIYLNGQWRDTSSLGPFGTLLFMGGSAAQSRSNDAKGRSQVGAAVTGAIQNVTSQSYLSGLTSAANALSDPTQFAGSEEKQLAGSVVPIAVATAARATDPQQRNAPGVVQSVESKIPGARETLSPQQDMFGRTLNREGGVTANLVDPSRPSGNDAGPEVKELDRLQTQTGTSAIPQQVKAISGTDANGKKVNTALNQSQQDAFNTAVGPKIEAAYRQIMNDPGYQQLTDANKAAALNSAKDNIETIQKAETLKSINGGTVKLTAAQQAGENPNYVQNKLDEQSGGTPGNPISAKLDAPSVKILNAYNGMTSDERTKAENSQNDYQFKLAQAQYNNNVANGKLTEAQKISAQASLAKDQAGTDYTKNVRDLYGLSNDELSNYLATNESGVDKGTLANQIIAYGDALAAAGVTTKNKFRTSKGVITLGDSADGTSPSQRSSAKSTKLKTVAIPSIKNNPYKSGGSKSQTFKQTKLPTIKAAVTHHTYKTPALKTNISAKLRKA